MNQAEISSRNNAADCNEFAKEHLKRDNSKLRSRPVSKILFAVGVIAALSTDAAGVSNGMQSQRDKKPPTVYMTAPATEATVSGSSVTVSATASDRIGITGVQFKLDSVDLGAEETTSPYSVTWNTSTATNGSHTLTAVARDAAGNTATAPAIIVTVSNTSGSSQSPDTTPPSVPAGLTATAISSSQITLSWSASTDNVGVAGYKVYRGGVQIATTANTTYQNTGLSPSTTYTYTFAAYDGAGNTSAQSASVSAMTQAPPDTAAPTVSFTAPTNGATVSGTISVSATASDNAGVAGVQFKLDGANLNAEETIFPYSIFWDTTTAANGTHTLTAVARDAAGNTTTSGPVFVTVSPGANLLFKSGFESGVTLGGWTDCGSTSCFQYLTGSDAGYSWQPFPLWNAPNARIHGIADTAINSTTISNYLTNAIETVTGHTGASTRALRQEVLQVAGSTQNYFRIDLYGNEPSDHLYIRYWMKQQPDLYTKMGIHAWRSFFWMKSNCDYRIESYIYTNSSGQEYWFTQGDNNYCGAYQQFWYDQDTTVPVPQGAWFPVEIYWKRSTGAGGRFWTAINGRVVFDWQGSTKISNPLLFIAPFGIYTAGGFPAYMWVDDIEIWDDFPCGAPPCGGPV
jgi:chitodextrinase